MERGEPRRGTELPAPYRSPWSGLADSLRAVVADLRLALRRLWRRNREGELPHPPFWPEGLAALFWPLLLSLLVVVAVGLVQWIRPSSPPGSQPSALDPAAPPAPAAGDGAVAGGASPEGLAPLPAVVSAPERAADGPTSRRAAALSASDPASGASAADGPAPGAALGSAASTEVPRAPELQLDPLLALLTEGEDAGLLMAARPDPLHGRLILTLSPAAEALPDRSLQAQADRWQQLSREAGYDRLELRDQGGALRGRDARVGSGMILLVSPPAA